MNIVKSNPGIRSQRTTNNGVCNTPSLSLKGKVIYPNKNKNEKGTVSGIANALLLLHSSFSTIGTV
jgi:hypothetical protein